MDIAIRMDIHRLDIKYRVDIAALLYDERFNILLISALPVFSLLYLWKKITFSGFEKKIILIYCLYEQSESKFSAGIINP